jgi:hypothetical protein
MFHDKTRLLGDKQYYYEFIATGRYQFRVKMNFPRIKQVSRFILILKINF